MSKHLVKGTATAAATLIPVVLAIFPTAASGAAPQSSVDPSQAVAGATVQAAQQWPRLIRPPRGAPNVLLILLDDSGFSDTSTFGGPAETPALDKLASEGLRYNNFNTASMCSPTRAALLTGRNHHRVGFGRISSIAGGYPGYDTVWKGDTASIARVLRSGGYATATFGKWHNTPEWEVTPIGPFERWPTGLGFEYFYGFIGAGDSQWSPKRMFRNTLPVDPPRSPAQGYHFTTDIVDEAVRWIKLHDGLAPTQPWFVYFAPGATHSPLNAPREWIERYRGRFDSGWDQLRKDSFARQKRLGIIPEKAKLTPRPDELPAWNSIDQERRRLLARQMEVYAGYMAHTDHEIGRLIQTAQAGPNSQNTLIIYIAGDNGPAGMEGLDGVDYPGELSARLAHISEMGGPANANVTYGYGWAWAGATPFSGTKGIASHLGGLRAPMVVWWPAGIRAKGGVRTQFTHVNDVASTIYEAARIEPPQLVDGIVQQPLDGTSFVYSFDQPDAPSRHRVQYFEMWSNRAVYQDGWLASARHTPWVLEFGAGGADPAADVWELYDLRNDFSQSDNLAKRFPDRLLGLRELFAQEGRRNGVYPLGEGFREMRFDTLPYLSNRGGTLTLYPWMERVFGAPSISGALAVGRKSYRIDAHIIFDRDQPGASVLRIAGAMFVEGAEKKLNRVANTVSIENGAAVFDFMISEKSRHQFISAPLRRGENVITLDFALDAEARRDFWKSTPGLGKFYVNDVLVEEAVVETPAYAVLDIGKPTTSDTSIVQKIVLDVR